MPEDKRPTSERARREEEILSFWKENQVFEKTLEKESPKGTFVFYEGPPTANGRPGIHHLEARSFKDAIPRYRTMRGFHVPRKAGWDTHGLPVELEVEKKLGLVSKKDIEKFGIDKFNEECRKSVGMYIDEWSKFTDRIGYWVNLNDAYFTYDNAYIQAVWSIISHVDERKLLYKDYKVVPWCPRCGTALSSHELAQGYADVKDLSVYAKLKVVGEESTFLLAWTTTPWTLPGNLALAVGKDIEYVKVRVGEEILILAESRLSITGEEYEIIEKLKGSDLVGLSYEPLYPFLKDNLPESEREKLSKAFKVYAADFVTAEDGTGIVHTAVMYGQEDFELGNAIGLPKFHLVDESGNFVSVAGFLAGKFVKNDETAVEIIKDLAHRGLLFKKEKYEHAYPHCWRCKTPLIYYARDSWYIGMSRLRNELIEENQKINWEPEYIKEGRFGEWLREVKDWAISRERYWGTPFPVWLNADGSKKIVVDSLDTIKKYTKKSGNSYFVMRHARSEGNEKELVSFKNGTNDHLTEEGKTQAQKSAEQLKEKKIDVIITSPFARTRETAEIIRMELGLPEDAIVIDPRIGEVNPGEFDGKSWHDFHDHVSTLGLGWFAERVPGGESFQDVGKRVGESLYELESAYTNKNILIVTHGGPAWLFHVVSGLYQPQGKKYKKADTYAFTEEFKRFSNAEVRELPFVPLPHNENYELDLHRPYIDDVLLEKDGEIYTRSKEVMDVWLDSGSMPFAQDVNKREKPNDFSTISYPADFISEAIDQTRGWFYTLHAVGTLMEKGAAYKNVICLGLLLDKDGKKMSKSVGNVVNPWDMIEKYGVDVLRYWMYSVNQPGESKNFDERTVVEVERRVFNLLDNVYAFYDLYRDRNLEESSSVAGVSSSNVLDKWILAKLSELIQLMTEKLDSYKLLEPTRELRDFIDDLSTWYVRRSRDRLKEGDREAKETLYTVLKTISKLIAPFAPFAGEHLYQKLRTERDPLSVHLESWPVASFVVDQSIISRMEEVRRIVSMALEARSKAGVKIRQPLQKLEVKSAELAPEYKTLIKEEINVKEVVENESLSLDVVLNTELTAELIEEGRMRELVRSIQELRKEKNLKPSDTLSYNIPEEEKEIFNKYRNEIIAVTNIEVEE